MGHYTSFCIEYEGSTEDVKKVENDFKALYGDGGYLNELIDTGISEMKWYDWEFDMKKVAKKNPNVLIILHGDGEESDDIWQARAKGKEFEFKSFMIPPFENPNLFKQEEKAIFNQIKK